MWITQQFVILHAPRALLQILAIHTLSWGAGVLGGFPSTVTTTVSIAVLSHWFNRQHALTALLATYVRYAGLPSDVQVYSLTVLSSMSFLGRVIPGFATDLDSRFNVLLSLVTVTLIIMAVVWLPSGSRDQATLYVVGDLRLRLGGLDLAGTGVRGPAMPDDYGRFYGTIYSVAAFGGLLTVPVVGSCCR